MSAPAFADLFVWEWRHVGRSPLLWSIVLILLASFTWGAVTTATKHDEQSADLERARADDESFIASTTERALAYRAKVTEGAGQVAYWQDPTNVAGYSEYFVRRHALKPHLPSSPLATGVSDLAPSRLEIKLNTPFGYHDTYDFENPRGLALGRFDFAFAVVVLLPIGLLLLCALLITFERDRGMLRLVAAQAVGPRRWIGARMAAILAWFVPAVLMAQVAALAIAGVPLGEVAAPVAISLVLTFLYMLFWSGIALFVLARQPSAGAALGLFAAIWALLIIGLPMAGSALLATVDPAPSAIEYVDTERRVRDEIEAGRGALLQQALESRPDLSAHVHKATSLDYATRRSFLIPETERRLAPLRSAIENHRVRQERIAYAAGFAILTLGIETAFTTLAGTDSERQRRFEQAANDYLQQLRARVYPLVQAEITQPPEPPVRETRGRLNLAEPLDLPEFVMAETSDIERIRNVLPFVSWLALVALVTLVAGWRRADEWQVT
jgi:ABC-2 type transport system permease protein